MATTSASKLFPDWWLFANPGTGYSDRNPASTPEGQAFLTAAQQYDPNASFTSSSPYNDNSNTYWAPSYDASKMPWYNSGMTYVGDGSQMANAVIDPSKVINDPVLGRVTPTSNINNSYNQSTWIDTVGPLAVAALAGAGGLGLLPTFGDAAGAAGAAGGAASGAASGASPLFDMGPWSGTGVADMTAGTGLTDSLAGAGAAAGAGAGALDTSGDSYLGLTDQGFPAFQGVPANPIADALVAAGMDPLTAGSLVAGGSSLLGKLPNILGKIPGLLGNGTGTGSGGGGGGGGGLISADQKSPYSSLLRVLQQYYGKGAM